MTSSKMQDFEPSLQRYLVEAKSHITKMAIFAFVVCLLPLAPLLLNVGFLWLLIVPVSAAIFVGKGLQSVLNVKQQAVESIKANTPSKMKLTALHKQFLWWNSDSSPGYQFDLAPVNAGDSSVQKLKADPANRAGVEKMKTLLDQFEQAKETNSAIPEVEAEVYFDNKQMPVALIVDGELLWAAYWW